MGKIKLIKTVEIEYFDDCFFRMLAISPEKNALRFRQKHPEIDFHKCRFECPIYQEQGFCGRYSSLLELNFSPIIQ